ncbi:MAG: GNAT family N-acetyltransferase [Oscillibacter sp.]|nr:GNAT family N-acetyltransferase [Oscillibacter sp.]
MDYQEKTVPLKNGGTCLLRRPEENDAEILIAYLKSTAAETRFFQREPEEHTETVEDEAAFIREVNEAERDLLLLAFVDGRFAGSCGMDSRGNKQRVRHRCDIGISLYQEFCGMGLGTLMLTELLEMARQCGYEQAELEVIDGNIPAMGLYRKLGFEAYGTRPRDVKYKDGTYADAHLMVKRL